MADRIYVTYIPTGGPESFHTAIHYERKGPAGDVIEHYVIEGQPERRKLSTPAKATGVVEEALRQDHGPSRFGRIQAEVRDGNARDAREYASDDPNAPYEILAEGDDLSSHLARMQLYAHGFHRAGFVYRGHHQNSNTFAGWALQAGGLPAPRGVAHDPVGPGGELLEFFTPGLNEPLGPPIGLPASDGPNVVRDINRGGSKNQGSSSATGSDDRLAPPMLELSQSQGRGPVRYLSRRIAGEPFDDRFGNWNSTNRGLTPRNPNLPVSLPEPGRPHGMFSGKPMPLWITPPPIGRFSDNSKGPGSSNELISPASGSGDRGQSQASMFDQGATIPPLAPSDPANYPGGLLGRLAAFAGIDPQNPDQFAPPAGGLLGRYLSGRR